MRKRFHSVMCIHGNHHTRSFQLMKVCHIDKVMCIYEIQKCLSNDWLTRKQFHSVMCIQRNHCRLILSTDERLSIRHCDLHLSNPEISLKWLADEKTISFSDVHSEKPLPFDLLNWWRNFDLTKWCAFSKLWHLFRTILRWKNNFMQWCASKETRSPDLLNWRRNPWIPLKWLSDEKITSLSDVHPLKPWYPITSIDEGISILRKNATNIRSTHRWECWLPWQACRS
jgi:hypothetical protein